MRTNRLIQTILAVVILIGSVYGVSVQSTRLPHPFQFTENKGQWDSAVLYKCEVRRDGFTWFLERDGVTLVTSVIDSTKPIDNTRFNPLDRDLPPRYALKSHALKFKFISECTTQKDVGINSDLRKYTCAKSIDAQGELSWHNNYFLGNDSSKWAPDCRNFTCIVYHDVWDGIDVEWYESKGHLEFDFVVHPGADPKQIRMVCEGLEAPIVGGGRTLLSVDSINSITKRSRTGVSDLLLSNELSLPTSLGELRMSIPGAYQTITDGTHGNNVTAQFKLVTGNVFAIDLLNGFDPSQTLRIDPLVYSTYLGDTGQDNAYCATGNRSTNLFISGLTYSTDFPISSGALQNSINGTEDAFITHISNSEAIEYSTYIGGSDFEESIAMVSDDSGNIAITGQTRSTNFPITNWSHFYGGNYDCFVTKINHLGSQILFSTYIGGPHDEDGRGIITDGNGGVIITGKTEGLSEGFISPNAYQQTQDGSNDCYLIHLSNTGNQIIYGTYLDGSTLSEGKSLVVDNIGSISVTGTTYSTDFPVTTGAFDTTYNGSNNGDCYITKLGPDSSSLIFSTFLGGSGFDWGNKIVNNSDSTFTIQGFTSSVNFPTTPGSFDTTFNGDIWGDNFIAKLNAAGSHLIVSTFLGGSGSEGGSMIANDQNSFIIAGGTSSVDYPTTAGCFDSTYHGGEFDCYVTWMNNSCSNIVYSSLFGGSSYDAVRGLIDLGNSECCLVGTTNSSDFPTTNNAIDTTSRGSYDVFITRFLLSPNSLSPDQLREFKPSRFTLYPSYPNPFNNSINIRYDIHQSCKTSFDLFDLNGRELMKLENQWQGPGKYKYQLSAKNLTSGVYFLRMKVDKQITTQKVVIVK